MNTEPTRKARELMNTWIIITVILFAAGLMLAGWTMNSYQQLQYMEAHPSQDK